MLLGDLEKYHAGKELNEVHLALSKGAKLRSRISQGAGPLPVMKVMGTVPEGDGDPIHVHTEGCRKVLGSWVADSICVTFFPSGFQ